MAYFDPKSISLKMFIRMGIIPVTPPLKGLQIYSDNLIIAIWRNE